MQHDDEVYVASILEMARGVHARVEAHARAGFDANEDLRLPLTHLIQSIGEAARQMSPAARARYPDVPWEQVIGMRHILVHNYLGVDDEIIWQVASHDIPRLIKSLSREASGTE